MHLVCTLLISAKNLQKLAEMRFTVILRQERGGNSAEVVQGGTNRVFGKPCFCPLPKRGRFDENGENYEFAFYPLKTRVSPLIPPKTTIMTKMAGATREKAWGENPVCSSLSCGTLEVFQNFAED